MMQMVISDDNEIMWRWRGCFQELLCRSNEEDIVEEANSTTMRANTKEEKVEERIIMEELQRILKWTKNVNPLGHDKIIVEMLKRLEDTLHVLLEIVNKAWKDAKYQMIGICVW